MQRTGEVELRSGGSILVIRCQAAGKVSCYKENKHFTSLPASSAKHLLSLFGAGSNKGALWSFNKQSNYDLTLLILGQSINVELNVGF